MGKVVAEVKIVPLGTGTPSVSAHVAKAVKTLQSQPKITVSLGSGSTTVEGEMRDVMAAITKAHNAVFSKEIQRVSTTILIDERRDKDLSSSGKMKALKTQLKKIKE